MRLLFALGVALLPSLAGACDVCGIFLGIQPHDRASSVTMLYRMRHLEGTLSHAPLLKALPKHGGHGSPSGAAESRYRELYQVLELRADLWLSDRFSLLASLPAVNNYRAVDGVIATDVYGIGDPLLLGRYLAINTRCTSLDERTVHRLMVGGGAKAPVGRSDLRYRDAEVPHDLQPGTGTWDLLASLEYSVRYRRNGASVSVIGRRNGRMEEGYRMGHGLSSTAEVFRRWDFGDDWKMMPSMGLYHELAGMDDADGVPVSGTGSSTLFTHAGVRVWWRSWAVMGTFQFAVARQLGELMVPNRERLVFGLTYNIQRN
ncbi:MAG: hypothetical protein QY325_01080 [Flavobacteriales bacterium]|nr:MAG: hypothetical protein QY325_01080 [Flavobacteriales bacterium]